MEGQILNGFVRANLAPNEVTIVELHSELSVIANFSALEMRASATARMTAKGIKYVEIDGAQNTAFPLNEAAEIAAGSNLSNGAGWRVSVAFEVICERVDVWSTDYTAQAAQRLGRGEKFYGESRPAQTGPNSRAAPTLAASLSIRKTPTTHNGEISITCVHLRCPHRILRLFFF
jgi:hypothetical protein